MIFQRLVFPPPEQALEKADLHQVAPRAAVPMATPGWPVLSVPEGHSNRCKGAVQNVSKATRAFGWPLSRHWDVRRRDGVRVGFGFLAYVLSHWWIEGFVDPFDKRQMMEYHRVGLFFSLMFGCRRWQWFS